MPFKLPHMKRKTRRCIYVLNFAFELVLPSVDYVQVIVGQPTPLLFGLALELLPVAFDSIPVPLA
jgi:hypothetical protein